MGPGVKQMAKRSKLAVTTDSFFGIERRQRRALKSKALAILGALSPGTEILWVDIVGTGSTGGEQR